MAADKTLNPEITGAVTALLKWAKPEIAAIRKHVGALELAVERISAIGDPMPSIEALAARVEELENRPQSTAGGADDLKSLKYQVNRHAEHLARLQTKITRLEKG